MTLDCAVQYTAENMCVIDNVVGKAASTREWRIRYEQGCIDL